MNSILIGMITRMEGKKRVVNSDYLMTHLLYEEDGVKHFLAYKGQGPDKQHFRVQNIEKSNPNYSNLKEAKLKEFKFSEKLATERVHKILDFQESQNNCYFISEDHITLREMLSKTRNKDYPLRTSSVTYIIRNLLEAASVLHEIHYHHLHISLEDVIVVQQKGKDVVKLKLSSAGNFDPKNRELMKDEADVLRLGMALLSKMNDPKIEDRELLKITLKKVELDQAACILEANWKLFSSVESDHKLKFEDYKAFDDADEIKRIETFSFACLRERREKDDRDSLNRHSNPSRMVPQVEPQEIIEANPNELVDEEEKQGPVEIYSEPRLKQYLKIEYYKLELEPLTMNQKWPEQIDPDVEKDNILAIPAIFVKPKDEVIVISLIKQPSPPKKSRTQSCTNVFARCLRANSQKIIQAPFTNIDSKLLEQIIQNYRGCNYANSKVEFRKQEHLLRVIQFHEVLYEIIVKHHSRKMLEWVGPKFSTSLIYLEYYLLKFILINWERFNGKGFKIIKISVLEMKGKFYHLLIEANKNHVKFPEHRMKDSVNFGEDDNKDFFIKMQKHIKDYFILPCKNKIYDLNYINQQVDWNLYLITYLALHFYFCESLFSFNNFQEQTFDFKIWLSNVEKFSEGQLNEEIERFDKL